MSGRKILLFLFVGVMALWGISQMFSPSGPNAESIYKMVTRLYFRSIDDVNKIMGKPGDKLKVPKEGYAWLFDSGDNNFFHKNSIVCVFKDGYCMALSYSEIYESKKQAAKRYDEILKGLSKKLGSAVRDDRGFLSWFMEEKKLGIMQLFFHDKKVTGVFVVIKKKDFYNETI